ncbi:hypothetical protein CLOM_g13048 [Closterium sp. NIES-68]|nr:hypothetical protein CLOM_g13048 [Closterium sp. NIES-68]
MRRPFEESHNVSSPFDAKPCVQRKKKRRKGAGHFPGLDGRDDGDAMQAQDRLGEGGGDRRKQRRSSARGSDAEDGEGGGDRRKQWKGHADGGDVRQFPLGTGEGCADGGKRRRKWQGGGEGRLAGGNQSDWDPRTVRAAGDDHARTAGARAEEECAFQEGRKDPRNDCDCSSAGRAVGVAGGVECRSGRGWGWCAESSMAALEETFGRKACAALHPTALAGLLSGADMLITVDAIYKRALAFMLPTLHTILHRTNAPPVHSTHHSTSAPPSPLMEMRPAAAPGHLPNATSTAAPLSEEVGTPVELLVLCRMPTVSLTLAACLSDLLQQAQRCEKGGKGRGAGSSGKGGSGGGYGGGGGSGGGGARKGVCEGKGGGAAATRKAVGCLAGLGEEAGEEGDHGEKRLGEERVGEGEGRVGEGEGRVGMVKLLHFRSVEEISGKLRRWPSQVVVVNPDMLARMVTHKSFMRRKLQHLKIHRLAQRVLKEGYQTAELATGICHMEKACQVRSAGRSVALAGGGSDGYNSGEAGRDVEATEADGTTDIAGRASARGREPTAFNPPLKAAGRSIPATTPPATIPPPPSTVPPESLDALIASFGLHRCASVLPAALGPILAGMDLMATTPLSTGNITCKFLLPALQALSPPAPRTALPATGAPVKLLVLCSAAGLVRQIAGEMAMLVGEMQEGSRGEKGVAREEERAVERVGGGSEGGRVATVLKKDCDLTVERERLHPCQVLVAEPCRLRRNLHMFFLQQKLKSVRVLVIVTPEGESNSKLNSLQHIIAFLPSDCQTLIICQRLSPQVHAMASQALQSDYVCLDLANSTAETDARHVNSESPDECPAMCNEGDAEEDDGNADDHSNARHAHGGCGLDAGGGDAGRIENGGSSGSSGSSSHGVSGARSDSSGSSDGHNSDSGGSSGSTSISEISDGVSAGSGSSGGGVASEWGTDKVNGEMKTSLKVGSNTAAAAAAGRAAGEGSMAGQGTAHGTAGESGEGNSSSSSSGVSVKALIGFFGVDACAAVELAALPHILAGSDVLIRTTGNTNKAAFFLLPHLYTLLHRTAPLLPAIGTPVEILFLSVSRVCSQFVAQVRQLIAKQPKVQHTGMHRSTVGRAVQVEAREDASEQDGRGECRGVAQSTRVGAQLLCMRKGGKNFKALLCQVLACPYQSICEHLQQHVYFRSKLQQVKVVVLNEPEMISMGVMDHILSYLPAHRQTIILTANTTRKVQLMADRILAKDYAFVDLLSAHLNGSTHGSKARAATVEENDQETL